MKLLPPTRCFGLKRLLLQWAGAKVGKNVRIVSSARFYLTGNLVIGEGTWLGHDVLVVGGDANVCIGAKVDIAPRVSLITGSHELFTEDDRAAGRGCSLPIVIEDGAWIGATSTILGGVVIGRCSVVAAGSLVNRHVTTGCLFGGVPARHIKSLK